MSADGDVDWTSFGPGLIWGIAILLTAIRFEVWLTTRTKRTPPRPVDPFDAARWDVLAEVRAILDQAADAAE
jgi:hypothetical protein